MKRTKGTTMRNEQKITFAIYCMVLAVVLAVGGVVLLIYGGGSKYVTGAELAGYLAQQPEECRPIMRARLARRLLQDAEPLHENDVTTVLREIDTATCRIASEQIRALSDVAPAVAD